MESTVRVKDDILYHLLNRSIQDVENRRELLLEEAFERITELRSQ